jgi:AbrB family looped-hinge helix DNA binding protein
MITETAKVGKRGTIVIPAALRQKYGLEEGSQIVVEPVAEGLLLRPVVTLPIEIYTPERKAEFLLNSAISSEDYAIAIEQVREMGLDPKKIPHRKTGKNESGEVFPRR